MNLIETISWLKAKIQADLFPHVEGCLKDPLTEKQKRLITTLEAMKIEEHVKSPEYQWMGRKLKDRHAIARAFIAKAVYDFNTTSGLIEALKSMPNLRRICGFDGSVIVEEREGITVGGMVLRLKRKKTTLPSESTFSRAFAEFAESGLGDRVHDALVEEHMSDQIIGHISRDATAIIGNEKPAKKGKEREEKKEAKPAAKKGRPKKGEERPKEDKRIEKQIRQTYGKALKELPTVFDCNLR